MTADTVVRVTVGYEPDLARYSDMHNTLLDAVFAGRAVPPLADPVRLLVNQGNFMAAIGLLRKRDGLDLTTARARVGEMQRADNRNS